MDDGHESSGSVSSLKLVQQLDTLGYPPPGSAFQPSRHTDSLELKMLRVTVGPSTGVWDLSGQRRGWRRISGPMAFKVLIKSSIYGSSDSAGLCDDSLTSASGTAGLKEKRWSDRGEIVDPK